MNDASEESFGGNLESSKSTEATWVRYALPSRFAEYLARIFEIRTG